MLTKEHEHRKAFSARLVAETPGRACGCDSQTRDPSTAMPDAERPASSLRMTIRWYTRGSDTASAGEPTHALSEVQGASYNS